MTRHAVIAGTGRAGTTFLVQFLAACGVPVGDLSTSMYFAEAHAGLERRLGDHDLPYLFKDPLFHEGLDAVDELGITLDALIVPMRDLREAAMSRVLRERTHIATKLGASGTRETFSAVPGGITYSLSVEDQERILAVGRTRLLTWAVQRSVPMYLVAFPRIVDDADYLIDVLWPWLQQFCDRKQARAAHHETADPSLVSIRDGAAAIADPGREQAERLDQAARDIALRSMIDREAQSAMAFEIRTLRMLQRIEKAVGSRPTR